MTTDTLQLHPVADSRAWARVFAAVYDPFLWIGERAGMRRHRHDLVTQARGRTLEIGSGTGLNLVHYPDDLDGLVLAEPDPSMRRRLENAVRRSERRAQVIDARAEQLPFGDASNRHGRLDARPVHGRRSRRGVARDRARAARRRAAAVHRACALRLAAAGPLAGSPRQAVAAFRGGVPVQPRDTRADGCVRVPARRASRQVAGDAADHPPAGRRSGHHRRTISRSRPQMHVMTRSPRRKPARPAPRRLGNTRGTSVRRNAANCAKLPEAPLADSPCKTGQ